MLIALVPFIFWAVGDFLAVFVVRKIGGYVANYWSFVLAVIVLSFFVPSHIEEAKNYSTLLLGANVVLGVIFLFGNQFYARALEKSNASLTNVIAGAFPAVTVAIALLLGERVTIVQGLGIILALSGVVVATLNFREIRSGVKLSDPGLIYAFFAMVCWGVFYALIKLIIERVGWFWPSYISFLCFPVIYFWLKTQQVNLRSPIAGAGLGVLALLATASLLVRGGEIVFNLALENNLSSLVTPLAGSYPVLFVVLAAIFLREKTSLSQWIGVVIGLVGIVVLAISGN